MKANLDKNLAPAWVSGKSYSTGEFCLYNKRLYICTTDNSDAEFDNSKWERRNLVDLVSGINSNLVSVKGKHWATFQELTTYECMLEVDNVYLVYTPGLTVTFTNASILSEKTLTTQGGMKYYCYLIKANSDIINMDISHSAYTIFVSPSLGKALTSTSFTIKTNSASAFTINTVTNGIYSYFVNCRANFTNAEVLSYVKDNDGFAYLIKAKSTSITVTNTDGAIYGGAFSSKLN